MAQKKKKIKNTLTLMGLALSLYFSGNSVTAGENNIRVDYSVDKSFDKSIDVDQKEDYIIQGVSPVRNNIFISAYNPNGKLSKVFIYDLDYSFVKDVTLYNKAHVGGITYDDKHDNIWITDVNGTISAYKYDDFITKNIVYPVIKQVDVLDDDMINIWGNKACAYITCHNNNMYVGNFNTNDRSFLKTLKINENGTIDLEDTNKQKFIGSVQGISFFDMDDNTYLCVSSSYGRKNNSKLRILKYNENTENLDNSTCIYMDCPPMLEQIHMSKEGKLISVYESNSLKYKSNKKYSSDLLESNLKEVINSNIKSL